MDSFREQIEGIEKLLKSDPSEALKALQEHRKKWKYVFDNQKGKATNFMSEVFTYNEILNEAIVYCRLEERTKAKSNLGYMSHALRRMNKRFEKFKDYFSSDD